MDTTGQSSLLEQAINTFEMGEVFPLVLAIVLMLVVAQRAARQDCPSYCWGRRFAFAAFLLWIVREVALHGFEDPARFAWAVFRALIVGAFTLTLTWLLFPVIEFCFTRIAAPIRRKWSRATDERKQRRHDRVTAQQRQREQLQAERRHVESEPRREQERQAAEVRERQRQEEQLRRENARFDCQVLYDRYRKDLASQFPEAQLQSYFRSYMSDERAADEVVRRAELLKTMLRECVEEPRSKRVKSFESIDAIAAHFREKKDRIRATDYDDDTKDTLIIDLEREETSILMEFLKR